MAFQGHSIRVGSRGVPGPGASVLPLGAVMSNSVTLNWTASSFYYGIAAYQVWRGTVGGAGAAGTPAGIASVGRGAGAAGTPAVIAIVGGGALTYTDGTVSAGTTYQYYVTATGNGFGNPQS